MRILSAGVISNFLVAAIAFLLLFGPVLGAIGATNSEMVVVNVAPGTAAGDAGIHNNLIIRSVDGINVSSPDQFNDYLKAHAGSNVTIAGMQGSQAVSYTVPVGDSRGVYILGVVPDYPAQKAGIGPHMQHGIHQRHAHQLLRGVQRVHERHDARPGGQRRPDRR